MLLFGNCYGFFGSALTRSFTSACFLTRGFADSLPSTKRVTFCRNDLRNDANFAMDAFFAFYAIVCAAGFNNHFPFPRNVIGCRKHFIFTICATLVLALTISLSFFTTSRRCTFNPLTHIVTERIGRTSFEIVTALALASLGFFAALIACCRSSYFPFAHAMSERIGRTGFEIITALALTSSCFFAALIACCRSGFFPITHIMSDRIGRTSFEMTTAFALASSCFFAALIAGCKSGDFPFSHLVSGSRNGNLFSAQFIFTHGTINNFVIFTVYCASRFYSFFGFNLTWFVSESRDRTSFEVVTSLALTSSRFYAVLFACCGSGYLPFSHLVSESRKLLICGVSTSIILTFYISFPTVILAIGSLGFHFF